MSEIPESQSAPKAEYPPIPPAAGHYQLPAPASLSNLDGGRKSPALATMLSAMPGLGQIYVGHYHQGFVNILVIGSLIAMLADGVGSLAPLMGVFLAFYWLFNMVDAGRRASFYNLALSRNDQASMQLIPMPEDRASLLAGVALTFFGTLFLLHNLMRFSLQWLEDWWPLGLVILGVYLIYKSVKDSATPSKAS